MLASSWTNRYGKAENRVVRIYRDTARPGYSTSCRRRCAVTSTTPTWSATSPTLPTDTQKNTAFAYAKDTASALRRTTRSPWRPAFSVGHGPQLAPAWRWRSTPDRIAVDGEGHDHAFVRRDGGVRTTVVDMTADATAVESGLEDLVVLKSTGSEFKGFLRDDYTTLSEADDGSWPRR